MLLKRCRYCDKDLPLSEFGKHKKGSYGTRSECRNCAVGLATEYRKQNPEKVKQTNKLSKKPYTKYKKNHCENCGFIPIHSCQLDVDHIDANHNNNDINNLQTLCANCHRLKTYLERQKDI